MGKLIVVGLDHPLAHPFAEGAKEIVFEEQEGLEIVSYRTPACLDRKICLIRLCCHEVMMIPRLTHPSCLQAALGGLFAH